MGEHWPRSIVNFFDQEIEPKALCRNCEYFDCQGADPRTLLDEYRGDCLNRASPSFTPCASDGCNKFWPDSSRWPDCDHD